jgi:serine/threonine protein kinase
VSSPRRIDLEADAETQLALAVVDGTASDSRPSLAESNPEMVGQLESVRLIRNAFDTLGAAPTATPPWPTWGPFVLKEEIGRGRFGIVCRAFDPAVDRDVAVKLYSGVELPAEPRWMGRVSHPNVVTVYGAATYDGRPGIWMELVRGRTLAQRVEAEGPIAPAEVVRIGIELCRALEAVHRAELVHQDLKPRNVMEDESGRIVLMDFGAGLMHRDGITAPEVLSGTPLYMAPEVLLGQRPSYPSDVYSLGVLLFYMLSGTYPVCAPDLEELRRVHERQGRGIGTRRFVAALRELRPETTGPLARCLARALAPAGSRYRTAAEFRAALARVGRGGWRRGAGWAGLAASVAAAALVAALRTRPAPGETPIAPPSPPATSEASIPPAPAETTGGSPASAALASSNDAYEVDARLLVRGSGGDRRLRTGDPVAPGDALVLSFSGSRPLYVYVVNRDEQGSAHLLFPLSDCRPRNPIAGGRRQVLPGRCGGTATAWQVSSAGGREFFLVMASPVRLTQMEEKLAALSTPRPSDERLRGVGERTALPEEAPVTITFPELIDLAEADAGPKTRARGLWHEEIVLENPNR